MLKIIAILILSTFILFSSCTSLNDASFNGDKSTAKIEAKLILVEILFFGSLYFVNEKYDGF